MSTETGTSTTSATEARPHDTVIPTDEAFPAEHVRRSTERSLSNLGMDAIDVMQFHVWNDEWVGRGSWLEAVQALKEEGKIRCFGVSINAARDAWGAGFADRRVTGRGLQSALALRLVPLVYTVNEPARMLELGDLGAGGIFTDRPELALPLFPAAARR